MIKAEIVAHSKNKQGDELISVLATFPRVILAEVNTHRMLSKNTSSSRAIPFRKMVEAIQTNPFIPIAWQKEHNGMQGSEYFIEGRDTIPFTTINGTELYANNPLEVIESKWLKARDKAVEVAYELNSIRVTKQLSNRLLEPFMWTTMLLTGSKEGWDNFFHLRCPSYQMTDMQDNLTYYKSRKDYKKDWRGMLNLDKLDEVDWLQNNKGQAEIHMMALAEAIWDAKNESTPKLLKPGEWHIPFEDKMGNVGLGEGMHIQSLMAQQHTKTIRKVKVSTAMAARTSYTVVGEEKEINPETLIGLHDRLIVQQPPHSSPMEHCSRCMEEWEREEFIKGKGSLSDPDAMSFSFEENAKGWCYNHKGFIPYRYLIDNNLTL